MLGFVAFSPSCPPLITPSTDSPLLLRLGALINTLVVHVYTHYRERLTSYLCVCVCGILQRIGNADNRPRAGPRGNRGALAQRTGAEVGDRQATHIIMHHQWDSYEGGMGGGGGGFGNGVWG